MERADALRSSKHGSIPRVCWLSPHIYESRYCPDQFIVQTHIEAKQPQKRHDSRVSLDRGRQSDLKRLRPGYPPQPTSGISILAVHTSGLCSSRGGGGVG